MPCNSGNHWKILFTYIQVMASTSHRLDDIREPTDQFVGRDKSVSRDKHVPQSLSGARRVVSHQPLGHVWVALLAHVGGIMRVESNDSYTYNTSLERGDL